MMNLPLVQPRAPGEVASSATLYLFGGPYVMVRGSRLEVPEGSKRVLAYVTLRGGRVNRRQAAGTLWPSGNDGRAAGNLRSALWRLKGAGIDVLRSDKTTLALDPQLTVDARELLEWADRMIDGRPRPTDLHVIQLDHEAVDIFPGWYDDWVVFERERLRQRLLHALEALSRRLASQRRYADAVEVAMTAVSIEPLRESAQRVLVQAHLDENNWIEAERAFVTYRQLVHDELGVAPSPELSSLIRAHRRWMSVSRIPSQRRSAGPSLAAVSDEDAGVPMQCPAY